MDLKDALNNGQLHWLRDVEDSLQHFPILLKSNEWYTGTNYHHQPGVEIHFTHEGTGTFVIGSQILPQNPRSVVVFRGEVPHQMISKSSYKRTVICVEPQDDVLDKLPTLHNFIDFSWIPKDTCLSSMLHPKQYQEIVMMCEVLCHELEDRRMGWERMALTLVLQISVLLQRAMNESDQARPTGQQLSGKKSNIVQACREYIYTHLDEDLTLKSVSKRFAVSQEYLTRSFSKEIGISYYQYVLFQRVAEGKRLLREAPDMTISEIAFMIGFPSSSHFGHHFKLLTEETPSSYRKRILEQALY